MRRGLRIAVFGLVALAAVLAILLFGAQYAARQAPAFYRESLAADRAVLEQASDAFLQQASVLTSDLNRGGEWHAVFTVGQINGWLAVDLVENHPGLVPAGVTEPRVAILDDRLTLAYRAAGGMIEGVVSVEVEVALPEPDQLALRLKRVRAGTLPLPMGVVIDAVEEAARQMDLRVTWRQANGDPVALIALAPILADGGKRIRVEEVYLGEGEVYVAGTTESATARAATLRRGAR